MESNKLKSFATIHPAVLMVYFLSEIVISMFSTNPIILGVGLVGGLLFFLMIQDVKVFLKDFTFYIPMFLLITIINPLFSHNGVTPLFFMNGNPVTMEAIIYGMDIALMLMAVIYWCKCYSLIMTTDKFLYLFGKAIPKLSLVLSMALRFIPLFKEKLHEIRNVQSSIGLYDRKGFVNKITSELKGLSALITWSLENSVETASSMKARGYGLKGRTHFSMYKFRSRDLIYLLTIVIFFGIVIVGMAMGVTDFSFYPEISNFNFGISQIIVYISFTLLSFIPFVSEVWEVIVWKYSVSKI